MTLKRFLLVYFLVILMTFMPTILQLETSELDRARVHTVDLAEMDAHVEDFSEQKIRTNGTVEFYGSANMNEDFWLAANEHYSSAIPVVASSAGLSVPSENTSIEVSGTNENSGLEGGVPYLNASSWILVEDIVSGTGTIRFLKLEGGFYGIVSDDGEHYDPVNLNDEFKVNGLRVRFEATIIHDVLTFHMWGSLISIRTIERL